MGRRLYRENQLNPPPGNRWNAQSEKYRWLAESKKPEEKLHMGRVSGNAKGLSAGKTKNLCQYIQIIVE